MTGLVLKSRWDSPMLRKAACSIEHAAWSSLGYLNYTRPHFELYGEVVEKYPDYQLCLVDEATGYPVAVATCAPIACDDENDLPDEGWDWVVEMAAASARPANTLGALAISVPAVHRANGYARQMIAALLALAARNNLSKLVAPVRPSAKALHPHVAIDDYMTWKAAKGRAFHPWLRSHLAAGGRMLKPCRRSMVVEEPTAFWETWFGARFDRVMGLIRRLLR